MRGLPLRLVVCGLAVFFVSLAGYLAAPVSQAGGDSMWVMPTSWAILHDGSLDISGYLADAPRPPGQLPVHVVGVNGRAYNYFPWGASVVAAPFVGVEAIRVALAGGDFDALLRTHLPLDASERHVASLIGATTVLLMMLLLYARTRSLAWAVAGALVFAFGTGVASTTTRALWIQGPALLMVVAALLCIYALSQATTANRARDLSLGAGAGACAVAAYTCRPTLAFLAVIVAAIALRRGRDATLGAIGGAAVIALAFFAVNLSAFGSLFPPYFGSDRLALYNSFGEAVAANLVSPARGLFVWSPVVLIGVIAYIARLRRAPLLDHLLVAWLVLHLLAVSLVDRWWAGWSSGPRFMLDVVPACFLLAAAAPALIWLRPKLQRRLLSVAIVVACGWSMVLNVHAMVDPKVGEWNWSPNIDEHPDRVWSVRSPQPLAGIRRSTN